MVGQLGGMFRLSVEGDETKNGGVCMWSKPWECMLFARSRLGWLELIIFHPVPVKHRNNYVASHMGVAK